MSRALTVWIVVRINVPWITSRRSMARVSSARSNVAMRLNEPTYAAGAYCVCSPPTFSSVSVSDSVDGSSRC